MKCAVCRPLLSKYVDGEATPAERAQVEAHIGGCAACSRLLVDYRVLRSRVVDLPNYRPDPRMRARLFATLDARDTPADEVPITRRPADLGPRPVLALPRRRGMLFGNLASSLALAIVIAAVALVWQIAGNPTKIPVAYATGTALVGGATNIPVPTQFTAINNSSLPNPQATAIVVAATSAVGDGHAASQTATFWNPSEDASIVHTVRDELYGYQFQYPAGWWTAGGLSTV